MEFHEIANMFPLMEGAEFDALVADIRKNGLLEPIWIYEDKILDGRNRHKACQLAGIKPQFVRYTKGDPLAFVVSKNVHRRHLNESQLAVIAEKLKKSSQSQRAVIAARIANMPAHRPENKSANSPTFSQPDAAKIFNVSERTIRSIKAIEREAPELIPEIKNGKITAHEAIKKMKAKKRQEERKKIAQSGENIQPVDRWNVYHGNIETIELSKQYDFIITDPPYPKEYLPLWEVLAKRAKEWLKPEGLLVAMSGQLYLNQIFEMFNQHLTYYWTACYLTLHQPTPLRTRNVNTTWKPVLIYGLNDKYHGKIFGDVYQSPKPEKNNHDWEQNIDGMYSLMKQICLSGQNILDPFCGSGTTGVAALKHGCFFDGIDIDSDSVNITKRRLHDTKKI